VSDTWFCYHNLTDFCLIVFGTPVLLKRKADAIMVDVPLPSPVQHSPSLPPHPCKHQCLGNEVLDHMKELLRVRSQKLDDLCRAQLVAQEALGVMAAAMLQQQGEMQALAAWEMEVGDLMGEMARMVEGEELDL